MLEIDDSKTVADIQDKFSRCFPHLKVEFCRKKHHWEALCSNKDLFSPQLPIGLIRKIHNPGIMEIKSWQKIGEVKRKFKDLFGLPRSTSRIRVEGRTTLPDSL